METMHATLNSIMIIKYFHIYTYCKKNVYRCVFFFLVHIDIKILYLNSVKKNNYSKQKPYIDFTAQISWLTVLYQVNDKWLMMNSSFEKYLQWISYLYVNIFVLVEMLKLNIGEIFNGNCMKQKSQKLLKFYLNQRNVK